MRSRNVMISLFLVLAMLVFIFMRLRTEPRKKLTFNRQPSRIEYSVYALCRMDCYKLNANSIAAIFHNGKIIDRTEKNTCTAFTIKTSTKQGMDIFMLVDQCGTVAKVTDSYIANAASPCKCTENETRPISYIKNF